jgi:membrane-associated phospholipid phosphatase
MKPIWERARPVNTTEFGGEKTYSNFYHLFVGQDGNSFPSGHAAMAFSLVALAFMVRPENRKKVLIITILYACLASMCRVWQGSHFISDVTFSGILTLWTVLLLKKFYLDKQNVNPQSDFA